MIHAAPEFSYCELFDTLPVAVIVARERVIDDCNGRALEIFRAERSEILGRSFRMLYPTQGDFESAGQRIRSLLDSRSDFSDGRMMRRLDGSHFWVIAKGIGINPASPLALTVWTFMERAEPPLHDRSSKLLTSRERDVATQLVDGKSSKEIARDLGISPRTVDIHRASLLRKFGAKSTSSLVRLLLA